MADYYNTETLDHLKAVLQQYIWSKASHAELDLLHAEKFNHLPYRPPLKHTPKNTAYLGLLAHVFQSHAEDIILIEGMSPSHIACVVEASRLKSLIMQSPTWSSVEVDNDWLEDVDSSESDDEEVDIVQVNEVVSDDEDVKTPSAGFTFELDKEETKKDDEVKQPERKERDEVKQPERDEVKQHDTNNVLLTAIQQELTLCPTTDENQILAVVYMDVHLDRDQFTDQQRHWLSRVFEKHMHERSHDKRTVDMCKLEIIRLSKNAQTQPESSLQSPYWRTKRNDSVGTSFTTPVMGTVVMEEPPLTLRRTSTRRSIRLRSTIHWCRDFSEMARSMQPAATLTTNQTPTRIKLELDLRDRMPDDIRDTEEAERLVRVMCAKYNVGFLRQVLNSMGDDE